MTTELAPIEFERRDAIVVAVVSGEIDMSNAAHVRQRIAEFVTPSDSALVLDLSSLSFIDSAGLHAVFELGAVLQERRQQLRVSVEAGSQVERTIKIIGLQGPIPVDADREVAVDAAIRSSSTARPFGPDD